jgi:DNA-binding response OmpR family regulator
MSNVLILSCKQILKKEEEEALARDNVQVTALTNYSRDLSKNINGDYDYILLDNALGSTDIYQVRRVGIISSR